METAIHQQYRAIRLGLPQGMPITLLHIGEQETAVAIGAGSEPEKILLLKIGSLSTSAKFFFHVPPTPGEIENAIMPVEDEITRVREMTAGYTTLVSADESIREIAHISNAAPQLSIENVEQIFSLLVSHSFGHPVSSAGVPDSAAFAATLLILREFMHHLKFTSINTSV
jgi:exopolyphosphatase/pppGpp-phosphohydrolase